jgi:hypothetical protein
MEFLRKKEYKQVETKLKRSLGFWDLVFIGVGGIIGAGIL